MPFIVYCDMTDKNGVGVTVISHDSESRTHVKGCEGAGCYSRNIHYTGASLTQLASLTSVSSHCEQFIKYECYSSKLLRTGQGWWVSRDYSKMTYWGGASPGSGKCACGMNNTCANPKHGCNCDANDYVRREDSGLLTDKTKLPVKQLFFLVIMVVIRSTATTPWENSSVMVQHNHLGNHTHKETCYYQN